MSGLEAWFGLFGPFALLVLVGFLPSEIWRFAAAVLARWVHEDSELFVLTRLVAAALVAAVVARLLAEPPPALTAVPGWGRVGALALGLAVFFATGRRLPWGIGAGAAAIVIQASLAAG